MGIARTARRLLVWIVWAALAAGSTAGAQEIEPLGPPAARAADGLTSVFDVAELSDGRVLVTDNRESALLMVDFEAGTVQRIGRRGQGPREYLGAFSIVPQADGFHVYDPGNARFLVVSTDGAVVDTRRFVRPGFSGLAPPRGPDDGGGVYFHLREVGGRGLQRRAVLYRWDTTTGGADSVATVMQYAPGQEGQGIIPMPVEDAWSVLPDGSVLVLRADPYRAEWSGGEAGAAVGDPIDHPRLRVDGPRRDEWISWMLERRGGGSFSSPSSPGSAGTDPRLQQYRRALDADRFPDFVPPFMGGYKPAAPWGEVWLRLETASDDEHTVFDVIGRRGELVRRVSVEGVAEVVGFGPESVYIVRADEFDLQWLERYDTPR